jgi:heterodisulfide reductase subunit C
MYTSVAVQGRQEKPYKLTVKRNLQGQASVCLQCHKCTAGCPVCGESDLLPSQVIRLVQLDEFSELLHSRAIWVCSSCRSCSARCPAGVDLAGIKDSLRRWCLQEGVPPGDSRIACAMETMLGSIQRFGRLNELDFIVRYKGKTGTFTENMTLGLALLRRGKLALLPARVRDWND